MKAIDCLALELECAESAVEALVATCERKRLELRRAEFALEGARERLERARVAVGQNVQEEK